MGTGDAFMLYTESLNTPNHIGALCILDPSTAPGSTVTFEDFTEHFRARVHLSRLFRQRAVRVPMDLDRPWWVDDDRFDLEHHLHHTALPRPGGWEQLTNLVARLHARPIDMSRPPWEMYLIEGLDAIPDVPEGCVALLARFHHSAVDGLGALEVLDAVMQHAADEPPPDPEADERQPRPAPTPWELLGRATVANLARSTRLAGQVISALPHAARLPGRLRNREVEMPTLSVPTTRFNAKVGPQRSVDAYRAPLDDLKRVRKVSPGSTINDVVLAVCGGALRRYLDAVGETPEASLAAAVPVSLRTGAPGQEGNALAQLFVDLHTDIVDPIERLAAVAETTRVAKESQPALGSHAVISMSGDLPGSLLGLVLRANAELGERTSNAMLLNTQVSNVPGPQSPLYCSGAQMLQLYGLGPVIIGASLIHIVMSYCGQVTFTVSADRAALPDADRYARCLEASLAELVEAATAAGAPGKTSGGL